MKSVVSSEKWQKTYYKLSTYILSRYNDADNIAECLYRMKNKIEIRPVCPVCKDRTTFRKFKNGFPTCCSTKCLNKYAGHILKVKDTCINRYGGNNPLCSKEVKEKSKRTCLSHYGVEYNLQAKEIRKQIANTCLLKYGNISYVHSKQYFESEAGKNACKSSKLETGFETYLQKYHINYKTQYTSVKYPYRCDFYLPDSDLYIELNGTWTHGDAPFNLYSSKDQEILKRFQEKSAKSDYYGKAIRTWTVLDLLKIEIAELNRVNLIVLYQHKAQDCFNAIIGNLSEIDHNKIGKDTIAKVLYDRNPIITPILDKLDTIE